jgi:hypothetical protein
MPEPRKIAEGVENYAKTQPRPAGGPSRPASAEASSAEEFFGYGVMGLPFRSGHVLGLRRFPVSSVGPGYRAVWHRDPDGRWTFYQDQPAHLACTRYFGSAVDEVRKGRVDVTWTGPRSFKVVAGDGDGELAWTVSLRSSATTRLFNAVGAALPDGAWRSERTLGIMSRAAGTMLKAGPIRLTGLTPDGQRFLGRPLTTWLAAHSTATIGGVDLGEMGPAPEAARLREFVLPQRGIFAVGHTTFLPEPSA